jgi:hypothetical protein
MCANKKESQTGEPCLGGRPRSLSEGHVLALREIAVQHPGAALETVTRLLEEHCGMKVGSMTVRRALCQTGIVRLEANRRAVACRQFKGSPKSYGYTEFHRREHPSRDYSRCLTDAEWALVTELFERPAVSCSMPYRLEHCVLADACSYVASATRWGCSWPGRLPWTARRAVMARRISWRRLAPRCRP